MTGPRIDHYDWAGGREAMLCFGPDDGPVVVAALPLFEEANRTRAFVVAICRALAARGIGSALPDLPGTGESLLALHALSLSRISEGYAGSVDRFGKQGRRVYGLGVRSGALLDTLGSLDGRWHLAPQAGPDLLRELSRIKQASLGPARALSDPWYSNPALQDDAPAPPVEIAGNLIGTALLTDLPVHLPWGEEDGGPVRTIRLIGDPRPADRHVPGTPLWRRSEPGNDAALVALLADDIGQWIARCGA